MIGLHAGGPNRYCRCRECDAAREDFYRGEAMMEDRYQDPPDGMLSKTMSWKRLGFLQARKEMQPGL